LPNFHVTKRKLSDCYPCYAKVRLLAQHYQQQGPLKTWNQSGLRQRQISGRSSVTVKKKRSAETELLMLGARTPVCV
jgi:hypothetical protein